MCSCLKTLIYSASLFNTELRANGQANSCLGLSRSSEVVCLRAMHKALGFITSTTERKYLSVCISNLSTYRLSLPLSVCLSVHLSIHISVYLTLYVTDKWRPPSTYFLYRTCLNLVFLGMKYITSVLFLESFQSTETILQRKHNNRRDTKQRQRKGSLLTAQAETRHNSFV